MTEILPELDQIWGNYTKGMTQVRLLHRAVESASKKEIEALERLNELLEKKPELREHSSSYQHCTFRSSIDGELRFFASVETTVEERRVALQLHKNRQYQWLLAESYEQFEDFLEHVYSFLGHHSIDHWPMSDFGPILRSEAQSKEISWFFQQTKNKRDPSRSILNHLRKILPNLGIVETANKLEVNLKLTTLLVEHLRHLIVHTGGISNDPSEFKSRVLEAAGLYNNGKFKAEHEALIDSVFGTGEYSNLIMLLEIPGDYVLPGLRYNVLEQVNGWLMAHAEVILINLNQLLVKVSGPE